LAACTDGAAATAVRMAALRRELRKFVGFFISFEAVIGFNMWNPQRPCKYFKLYGRKMR
jgi:hypothetical protein